MDLLKNLNIDKIRNAAEDALNQAKPKTEVEARIYEALSHKNWGSSSTLMNEIARDSFDYDKFNTVTRIIWESLENPRPAAWRVVFKALTLLEHLVKNGSERCVDDGRNHSHTLRGLFNFNYYEGAVDRGQGVREKAKQVVELLQDDERIREERMKAKQLREKFGGNLGGVSNGGGGSMGGFGGGGSGYAGYGNDSDSYNYNGSGGYGDSGIGSSGGYSNGGIGSSGGYSDGAAASSENNFSGRYAEEADTSNDIAPTFATIPEKKTKKKSKKSKKKKEKSLEAPAPVAPAAPEVDLLAMDDPAPTPAAADDDGFDAFQGAPADDAFDAFQSAPAAAPAPPANDDFDAFQSAPAPAAAPVQQSFDAFGANPTPAPVNTPTFDAFGGSNGNTGGGMNGMNNAFGNMNMGSNNMMGMQQQQMMGMQSNIMGGSRSNVMGGSNSNIMGGSNSNVMGGGNMNSMRQSKPAANDDDDFGDFDDGKSKTSSDPLSNLISLDGLTKNKKNEDKTNEPIAFNAAAKAYIQSSVDHTKPLGTSKIAADLAFSGVDGLHKQTSFTSMNSQMGGTLRPGQSVMNSGGGSNSSMIGAMSGQMGNMQQQQNRMGMGNMMSGMNNNNNRQQGNMMGGMGMNMGMQGNNMMGGGMNNNTMNNGMMGGMNQQGGMMGGMNNNMNMGNNGGMNQQGNMMGGMNNNMMNNNMMGGMGMGGGNMNQARNTMGGQPMGGWQ